MVMSRLNLPRAQQSTMKRWSLPLGTKVLPGTKLRITYFSVCLATCFDDAARSLDAGGALVGGEVGRGSGDAALVGELTVHPELAEAAAEDADLVAVERSERAGSLPPPGRWPRAPWWS